MRRAIGVLSVEIFHLENHLARRAVPLGETLLYFAPHHIMHQFFDVQVLAGLGGDDQAVSQHGDGIRNAKKLFQLVGDIDAGDAMLLERAQDLHELFDLGFGERARRLVEDQYLGVLRQRLGNLGHLPLAHAQVLDHCLRLNVQIVL